MEVAFLVNGSQTKLKFVLTWWYRQGLWRYPTDPTAGDLGGMVPNLTSRTFGGNIRRVKSSHDASGPPIVAPFFLLSTRSAILCLLFHPHSIHSQIPSNRRDLSMESALVASFEVIFPTSSYFLVKICACFYSYPLQILDLWSFSQSIVLVGLLWVIWCLCCVWSTCVRNIHVISR
jgi:hypothetical protein